MTSISDYINQLPLSFTLHPNYPNPFNPSTVIKYSTPTVSKVKLSIFNSTGEEIAILVDKTKDAGIYEVIFIAHNLTSGMYLYQIRGSNYFKTKKMVLLK